MSRARTIADYGSTGVTAAEFDFLDTTSGTPGSGNFLRGDKTWAEAGGANTPTFMATKNDAQSFTYDIWNKVEVDDEDFNVGGCYNDTGSAETLNGIVDVPAYAFAPNVAGKYYLIGGVGFSNSGSDMNWFGRFYKNDVATYTKLGGHARVHTSITTSSIVSFSTIVEANGSSDFFELYAQHQRASGTGTTLDTTTEGVFFGAFKIIE